MSDYVKQIGYIYRLDDMSHEDAIKIAEIIGQDYYDDHKDKMPYFDEPKDYINKWILANDENSPAIGLKKTISYSYGEGVDVYHVTNIDTLQDQLYELAMFISRKRIPVKLPLRSENFKVFVMNYYNCCESPLTFVDNKEEEEQS